MTDIKLQTPPGCVWLAQGHDFLVYGDHDYVYIKHSDGRTWDIGGMYGNAVAALITWDERYAVIVGCGIMICDLERFGEKVTEGESWSKTPVAHLMAEPDILFESGKTWWFNDVEQVSADEYISEIRLATALTDVHVGIYSLNPQTFEFRPVPHGEPIR
ncbi:hypothetical protein Q0M94_14495 [Deinococcus radiomollis]|uniref:hypothetical protein n=1 Tax=Deinococcus radiomollis TaxID=468916 RepID=UPI0038921833